MNPLARLPQRVVALRGKVFNRVNGDDAITIPNEHIGVDRFMELYSHPAANGRSKGAGLSDLFWYWLSPGPEVHQEHLEPGPRYDDVARTTLSMLAGPSRELSTLAAGAASSVLDELVRGPVVRFRLRDLMMPIWAEYCYRLVFDEDCPRHARDLIVGHADDVVTSLKCTGLRHPRRRARLTAYLRRRVVAGDVKHQLPQSLDLDEQVHYLQGTFFNTAVVQLSEGMAHLLLALAQHPEVQQRLADDPSDDTYFRHVLDETMRLYPLFGIAHRITTDDIALDDGTALPEGSVLCFSYPDYHSTGYRDPAVFDPARWEQLSAKDAHHIPFGIAANRPCPAWRISPLAMRAVTTEVLRRFRLASSVSHTRSIPHRAPCLLLRRDAEHPAARQRRALRRMRARDRAEDLLRSILQLGLGTWMVLDARRKRLAGKYFEQHDTQGCPVRH
ncbi:MAG TPA: cytochrome P450 [Stackebrandtia sp.]|uniref:cytochrome P450 n=1 Tax=Stackebrandtia sp. TaxID=2023065 RepID=UPI002D286256|nr:cytochrome P450 [Stackebrandtia sp.]HZE37549.1 cytochrome P450 [Stackebrandtia sp.]